MKICSRCFREFNEREDADYDPAVALVDISVEHIMEASDTDLCPECRKELGMANLMGFGM